MRRFCSVILFKMPAALHDVDCVPFAANEKSLTLLFAIVAIFTCLTVDCYLLWKLFCGSDTSDSQSKSQGCLGSPKSREGTTDRRKVEHCSHTHRCLFYTEVDRADSAARFLRIRRRKCNCRCADKWSTNVHHLDYERESYELQFWVIKKCIFEGLIDVLALSNRGRLLSSGHFLGSRLYGTTYISLSAE